MCNFVWGQMVTRLIMVIILKHLQMSTHYVVLLKLIKYCISIILQLTNTFLVKDLRSEYIKNSENLIIVKQQYKFGSTAVACAVLVGII